MVMKSVGSQAEMAPKLTRRAFLGGVASLPFASAGVAQAPLVDRIMVQGRPQDTGSLYKVANIMPALDALGGVRKMRCRAPFSNTAGWNTYAGLARQGVRFCFTLPVKEPAVLVQDIAIFEGQYPGATWAIEFPNEPDLHPVEYGGVKDDRLGARTGNAPTLMAYCKDVTALLESSEILQGIPRIAFNDWMQAEQSEMVTYANSHIYPKADSRPDGWLEHWKTLLADSGKSQGVITEWGRTTGGTAQNSVAPPVSLDQQAELLRADLMTILDEPSVATVSLYELLSWPSSSEQDNFGLFNSDLSPRPVVQAIRALIA